MPRTIATERLKTRNLFYSIRLERTASDAIIVPTTFDPSQTDLTILLWFKAANLPLESTPAGDHNIYAQQDGAGTGRSWLYVDRLNNNFSTFFSGSTQNFSLKCQANKWYRLALTVEAQTTATLYADSQLVSSNTVTITSATGSHVIGNNKALTGVGYCLVSDIRLYNRILTLDELTSDYYDGTFVYDDLYYQLDLPEGSGSSTQDSGQMAFTASLNSSFAWSSDVPMMERPLAQERSVITLERALAS